MIEHSRFVFTIKSHFIALAFHLNPFIIFVFCPESVISDRIRSSPDVVYLNHRRKSDLWSIRSPINDGPLTFPRFQDQFWPSVLYRKPEGYERQGRRNQKLCCFPQRSSVPPCVGPGQNIHAKCIARRFPRSGGKPSYPLGVGECVNEYSIQSGSEG